MAGKIIWMPITMTNIGFSRQTTITTAMAIILIAVVGIKAVSRHMPKFSSILTPQAMTASLKVILMAIWTLLTSFSSFHG